MAAPHDFRHCKWARNRLAADLPQGRPLWKDWAGDSDERKELLPCPLLEPAIRANKRAQRRQQEAPATKAVLGVDAGSCARQEYL